MQGGHPLLRWLAVALLLGGVAIHGYRIVARDEDPQRGSAFAMFATADIGATRNILATVPGEPGLVLEIPEDLQDEREDLADSPDNDEAGALAESLLALTWTVEGDEAEEGGSRSFDAVHVQVVSLEVDGRTLTTEVLAEGEAGSAEAGS